MRERSAFSARQDAERLAVEVGERIRQVYIEERRAAERLRTGVDRPYYPGQRWDGDRVRKAGERTRKAIWPGLAEFFIANGLDPDAYVRQCFRYCRTLGRALMPNQLTGEWLLAAHREWEKEYGREIAVAFDFQKNYARSRLTADAELGEFTREQLWRLMLYDDKAPLSALFRYCLAVGEGFAEVAAHYREAALRDYLLAPEEYDRQWPGWIPPELVYRADQVRSYLRRKEHKDA